MSERYTASLIAFIVALSLLAGFLYGVTFSTPIISKVFNYDVKPSDWFSFLGALLGAALTIIGAVFISIYQHKKQMQIAHMEAALAEEHADKQRNRIVLANRAVMALDLSAIMQYLADCAEVIISRIEYARGQRDTYLRDCPRIEMDTLLRLTKFMEAEPPGDLTVIIKVLNNIQIQSARMQSYVKQGVQNVSNNPDGRRYALLGNERVIAITLCIYMQATTLFSYARLEENEIPRSVFDGSNLHAAINILGFSAFYNSQEDIESIKKKVLVFFKI